MSVSNISAYKKLEDRSKITNLILRYLLYIILALFAFYFNVLMVYIWDLIDYVENYESNDVSKSE